MRKATSKVKPTFVTLLLFLIACSMGYKVTKVTVQSLDIEKSDIAKEKAVSTIANIFVDRGFDIKMSDKEAGIITTEFKKFGSAGDNPPFDYYLQIKATVRPKAGKMHIKLSPIVKGQNRLNVGAFTEEELSYYTGDLKYIKSMKPQTGLRPKAILLFNNVVTEVAESFGLKFEDTIKNLTRTPKVLTVSEAYSLY